MAEPTERSETKDDWFTDIRKRLDELELEAPVVSERIYSRIEGKYSNVVFIGKAEQLYQSKSH